MKKLLLVTLFLIPTAAFADSFALATATIDWSKAGWATNGSIVVTDVYHSSPNMRGMDADGRITTSALAEAIDGGDTIYRMASSYIIDSFWLY